MTTIPLNISLALMECALINKIKKQNESKNSNGDHRTFSTAKFIPISTEQEDGFEDWDIPQAPVRKYYFLLDPDLHNEFEDEESHAFSAEELFDAVTMAFYIEGPTVRSLTRIVWQEGNVTFAINISPRDPINKILVEYRPKLMSLHMGPPSWSEGEWGLPDYRSDTYRAWQKARVKRYKASRNQHKSSESARDS